MEATSLTVGTCAASVEACKACASLTAAVAYCLYACSCVCQAVEAKARTCIPLARQAYPEVGLESTLSLTAADITLYSMVSNGLEDGSKHGSLCLSKTDGTGCAVSDGQRHVSNTDQPFSNFLPQSTWSCSAAHTAISWQMGQDPQDAGHGTSLARIQLPQPCQEHGLQAT